MIKQKHAFLTGILQNNYSVAILNHFLRYISKPRCSPGYIGYILDTPTSDIADSSANFFSSVFVDGSHSLWTFTLLVAPIQNVPNIKISEQSVDNLIKIRTTAKLSPDELQLYGKKGINQSCVLQDWKGANVIPVNKSKKTWFTNKAMGLSASHQ